MEIDSTTSNPSNSKTQNNNSQAGETKTSLNLYRSGYDSMNGLGIRIAHRNHRIEIPHRPVFNNRNRNELTIECDVCLDKQSTGYFVVQRRCFALGVNNENFVRFSLGNAHPGWIWKTTSIKLSFNEWTHLAITYNASDEMVCIIVDAGKLVEKFPSKGPLEISDHPLFFGLSLEQEKNCMNVTIKNVKWWSRALSVSQLKQNYTAMKDWTKTQLKEALIGWWPVDEKKGTVIHDRSGNELHGELLGAQWVFHFSKTESTFKNDLRNMVNNPIGSDIMLKTASQTDGGSGEPDDSNMFMYAHKIILTQRSQVFNSMLLGGMRESYQKEIIIQDISFRTLSQLVQFMYTDEITLDAQDYNDIIKLFEAADRFAIHHLKNACEEHLINSITIDNVCQLLDCADRMDSFVVRCTCKQWILNHFGEVLKSEAYLQLPKDLLAEINKEAANIHFSPPAKKQKVVHTSSSGLAGGNNNNTTTTNNNNNAD